MSTSAKRTFQTAALAALIMGTGAYAGAQQHHPQGMHGDQGGMMMSCMGDGGSCPMMDMRTLADVQIENTKSGAIIHVNAKKADQVAQIQKLAQRMTQCMGNAEPASTKTPAAAPPPAKTAPANPNRAR